MVHEAMGEKELAATVEKAYLSTVEGPEREALKIRFKEQREQVAAMLQGAMGEH